MFCFLRSSTAEQSLGIRLLPLPKAAANTRVKMNFFMGSSPDFFSLKLQIISFGLFHVLVSPGCQEQGSAGEREWAGRCLQGRGTVSKMQCLVLHLGVQQMSRVADGCPMSMLIPPGLSKPLACLVPSPSPVPGGENSSRAVPVYP